MDIARAFGHEIDLQPVKARSDSVFSEISLLQLVGLPFRGLQTLITAVCQLDVVRQLMQQNREVARIGRIPGPHQDDAAVEPVIALR